MASGRTKRTRARGVKRATPEPETETPGCSVCFNSPMMTPILQCSRGHILCYDCEARVATCPTCQEPLSKHKKIRNLVLERMQGPLEECTNRGCDRKFLTIEDVRRHVLICPYKKINLCRHFGIDSECSEEFHAAEAGNIAAHLIQEHSTSCRQIRLDRIQYFGEEVSQPFSFAILDQRLIIFVFLKTLFNRLWLAPFMFANSDEAIKYRINCVETDPPGSQSEQPYSTNSEPKLLKYNDSCISFQEFTSNTITPVALDDSTRKEVHLRIKWKKKITH